jgi:hypothetical protein
VGELRDSTWRISSSAAGGRRRAWLTRRTPKSPGASHPDRLCGFPVAGGRLRRLSDPQVRPSVLFRGHFVLVVFP